MTETCPYCGETAIADVVEYWPEERAWMFDACCEGMEADLRDFAEHGGRDFGRWFQDHAGVDVRQAFRDLDYLRLDFGLLTGPVDLATAKAFVQEHHRHRAAGQEHHPPTSWTFGFGCYNGVELVAVVMVGRPVARMLDDGSRVEVNRLCVNPELCPELVWNACSQLYTAAAKEAARRGYTRIVTYVLETETAGTLKAAGWTRTFRTKGGSWDRPSRPRTDKAPTCRKYRWERGLSKRERKILAHEGRDFEVREKYRQARELGLTRKAEREARDTKTGQLALRGVR